MNIDINKVLEELKDCRIDEYDLKPLMIKGIRAKFRPDLYPDENQIVLLTCIEDSYEATKQKYIEQFDTYENAVLWHEIKRICNDLSLRDDEKGGMMIRRYERYSTTGYAEIVQLIRYAVLGIFDPDLAEAHKITDELRTKDGCLYSDIEATTFNVLKIKVQTFKNRKTIICGLTDKQRKRIVDAFAHYEKYR